MEVFASIIFVGLKIACQMLWLYVTFLVGAASMWRKPFSNKVLKMLLAAAVLFLVAGLAVVICFTIPSGKYAVFML